MCVYLYIHNIVCVLTVYIYYVNKNLFWMRLIVWPLIFSNWNKAEEKFKIFKSFSNITEKN